MNFADNVSKFCSCSLQLKLRKSQLNKDKAKENIALVTINEETSY